MIISVKYPEEGLGASKYIVFSVSKTPSKPGSEADRYIIIKFSI
jgi:hypothetical protein